MASVQSTSSLFSLSAHVHVVKNNLLISAFWHFYVLCRVVPPFYQTPDHKITTASVFTNNIKFTELCSLVKYNAYLSRLSWYLSHVISVQLIETYMFQWLLQYCPIYAPISVSRQALVWNSTFFTSLISRKSHCIFRSKQLLFDPFCSDHSQTS